MWTKESDYNRTVSDGQRYCPQILEGQAALSEVVQWKNVIRASSPVPELNVALHTYWTETKMQVSSLAIFYYQGYHRYSLARVLCHLPAPLPQSLCQHPRRGQLLVETACTQPKAATFIHRRLHSPKNQSIYGPLTATARTHPSHLIRSVHPSRFPPCFPLDAPYPSLCVQWPSATLTLRPSPTLSPYRTHRVGEDRPAHCTARCRP